MTLEASGVQAALCECQHGDPAVVCACYEVEPAPPPAPLTMGAILHAMTEPERMLDLMTKRGFDAATLVDELALAEAKSDEALAALGAKVDALQYVVDQFESYAQRTAARAAALASKASAAKNHAARVRNRLLDQMEFYKFERLPGVEFAAERVRASKPAVQVNRNPTAADMLTLREFVKEQPAEYVWIKDKLCEALKAREESPLPEGSPDPLAFASLDYSYSVKFKDRDRPDVATKKKGRKK